MTSCVEEEKDEAIISVSYIAQQEALVMDIISQLRAEHLNLAMSFESLNSIDLKSEESRAQLHKVKKDFLTHLRIENDNLYPKLRDASFNNYKLQQTLDWFTRDLARVSAVILLFLDKYADGGAQHEYKKDCKRLEKIFNALLKQEENLIFPEYIKLQSSDKAA